MNTATQAIELVESLVEANIPKLVATQLLDYVDGKESNKEILTQVNKLEKRVDGLDNKVDNLDHKVHALDNKVDSLDHKVNALDNKVDSLDHKVENLDSKVDSLDHKVNALDNKVDGVDKRLGKVETKLGLLMWIMGVGVTVIGGGLLTVMLYLHSDTKADMKSLEAKLDQIIQNQAQTKPSLTK